MVQEVHHCAVQHLRRQRDARAGAHAHLVGVIAAVHQQRAAIHARSGVGMDLESPAADAALHEAVMQQGRHGVGAVLLGIALVAGQARMHTRGLVARDVGRRKGGDGHRRFLRGVVEGPHLALGIAAPIGGVMQDGVDGRGGPAWPAGHRVLGALDAAIVARGRHALAVERDGDAALGGLGPVQEVVPDAAHDALRVAGVEEHLRLFGIGPHVAVLGPRSRDGTVVGVDAGALADHGLLLAVGLLLGGDIGIGELQELADRRGTVLA